MYPFSKVRVFHRYNERTIYEFTYEYFQKYTKPPTVEALLINLDNSTNVNEKIITDSKSIVEGFGRDDTPQDWLLDETEKWCKDRAIYIAVMDSIEVIDKKSQQLYW